MSSNQSAPYLHLQVIRQNPESSHDLNELFRNLCSEEPEQLQSDKVVEIRKRISYLRLVQFCFVSNRSPEYYRLVCQNILQQCYSRNSDCVVVSFAVTNADLFVPVDRYWESCILKLVLFRMELEDSLSWLSTLGGAFSSYGEYDLKYAKKAQRISMHQLKLACISGDPNLISRALIYICYAGCQQGYKPLVKRFVKQTVHPFMSRIPAENLDRIVAEMYRALCYRIKYFYK